MRLKFEEGKNQIIITGGMGTGKTRLALEYCFREMKKYNFLIWCPADNLEVLYSIYYKFCLAAGILEKKDKIRQEMLLAKIKEFCINQKNTRCLFIYDGYHPILGSDRENKQHDVRSKTDIKEHLLINVENTDVIITSRDNISGVTEVKQELKFNYQVLSKWFKMNYNSKLVKWPNEKILSPILRKFPPDNPLQRIQSFKTIISVSLESKKELSEVLEKLGDFPDAPLEELLTFNLNFYLQNIKMAPPLPNFSIEYFLFIMVYLRHDKIPINLLLDWLKEEPLDEESKSSWSDLKKVLDAVIRILSSCAVLTIEDHRLIHLFHPTVKDWIRKKLAERNIAQRHTLSIKVIDFLIEKAKLKENTYSLLLHFEEATQAYQIFLDANKEELEKEFQFNLQYSTLQQVILLRCLAEIYISLNQLDCAEYRLNSALGLIGSAKKFPLQILQQLLEENRLIDLLKQSIVSASILSEQSQGMMTSDLYSLDDEVYTSNIVNPSINSPIDILNDFEIELRAYEIEFKKYADSQSSFLNRILPKAAWLRLDQPVFQFMLGIFIYDSIISAQRSSNFEEFIEIFNMTNDDAYNTLVVMLADLSKPLLSFFLAAPFLSIIAIFSLKKSYVSNDFSKLKENILCDLEPRNKKRMFFRDIIVERISHYLLFSSLNTKINQLVKLTQGSDETLISQREEIINLLANIAEKRPEIGIVKSNAIDLLTEIINKSSAKPRDLTDEKDSQPLIESKNNMKLIAFYRLKRLADADYNYYARYSLWSIGKYTAPLLLRILFTIIYYGLSLGKLTIEIMFLQKILASIAQAIRCQNKPSFFYDSQSLPWASDYDFKCFSTRINFFRTIDVNESVDSLVDEIYFYDLAGLKELSLPFKNLTTDEAKCILSSIYTQGARLSELDLSGNNLYSLDKSVFYNLKQLQILNLTFCHISNLDNNVFSELELLQELYLSSNEITRLNVSFFSNLLQLKTLGLSSIDWTAFNENIFSGLLQLETLDLSNGKNEQNFINNNNLFSSLKNLKSLSLSGSNLNTLNSNIFASLYALQVLDLSKNNLSFLSIYSFSPLTDLLVLNLDDNPQIIIDINIFSGLKNLQKLGLRNNGIDSTTCKQIFSVLPDTVNYLDMHGNNIDFFNMNLSFPLALKSLFIGNNQFIPSVLNQTCISVFPKTLTLFSLQQSNIDSIEEKTFVEFTQLIELDLSHNKLVFLNNLTFYGMEKLENLILSSNLLTTVEGAFDKLPGLEALDLDNNNLTDLPEGIFSRLNQLQELDLSSNFIKVLSKDIFSNLTKLNRLSLISNSLIILDQTLFYGLNQLEFLDLSFNDLIDDSIKNMTVYFPPRLISLDISNNWITDAGLQLLTHIVPCSQLTEVDYSKNPGKKTDLTRELQEHTLETICADDLCHANLPPVTATCDASWGYDDGISSCAMQPIYSRSVTTVLPENAVPSAGMLALGIIGLGFIYKKMRWIKAIAQNHASFLKQDHEIKEDKNMRQKPPKASQRYQLFQPHEGIHLLEKPRYSLLGDFHA